ncbi:uncharacterized protein DKFZp434B061-like [Symphalangus syndactylus]|uniref:uncharacterized protein DKFZp434B061-like n=1 Tax=Symphalangus syndactylus TaxID=9590 RepID=UPI003003D52E
MWFSPRAENQSSVGERELEKSPPRKGPVTFLQLLQASTPTRLSFASRLSKVLATARPARFREAAAARCPSRAAASARLVSHHADGRPEPPTPASSFEPPAPASVSSSPGRLETEKPQRKAPRGQWPSSALLPPSRRDTRGAERGSQAPSGRGSRAQGGLAGRTSRVPCASKPWSTILRLGELGSRRSRSRAPSTSFLRAGRNRRKYFIQTSNRKKQKRKTNLKSTHESDFHPKYKHDTSRSRRPIQGPRSEDTRRRGGRKRAQGRERRLREPGVGGGRSQLPTRKSCATLRRLQPRERAAFILLRSQLLLTNVNSTDYYQNLMSNPLIREAVSTLSE